MPSENLDVHTIRLIGPWTASSEPDDSGCRVKVPLLVSTLISALHSSFQGRQICLQRYFNCPTGLTGNQKLWLVVDSDVAELDVTLNGQPLIEHAAGENAKRYGISSILQSRNELIVAFASSVARDPALAGNDFLLRNVQLEIVTPLP